MAVGAIVAIAWGMSPLGDSLYELVPGFISSLVVTVAVSLATKAPDAKVTQEFEEASRLAKLVEENKNLDFEEAAEKVQK